MAGYVKPETKDTKPVKTAQAETTEEAQPVAWLDAPARPVLPVDMISGTQDAVSKTFTDTFERYIRILEGSSGVPVDKLGYEQVLFMKTLSNTLNLNFERYAIVTDWLVLRIKANQAVLTSENIFRLVYHIPSSAYKPAEVERYKKYMMALVVLSENLQTRQRVGRLIDIASLAKGYKASAAQNITQYFQRTYS